MTKSCVIYVRVSTAEQAAAGHHSLDAQEGLCRRYAADRGYDVAEVIRDEGYSGRTTLRPGFKRLLEYTGTTPPARINAILVQDTSRVGRDTTEYLLFRRDLQQRGIELIAVTQPNIDASPEGRLVDTVMAAINQYQSEEKGRRITIALEKKFRDGWWPGWAPPGYTKGEQEGRHIVVADPERFPLVEFAFRAYATGRYTQDVLRRMLVDKGFTGRDGRPLSFPTLNELLANPFYWGLMRWNGMEQMGKHPPATDRRTWEYCQLVTARRAQSSPRTRKHTVLLAGMTVCAACGGHHTRSIVARKQKQYYHCQARAKCDQPYIPVEKLDAQAARLLDGVRLSDTFIDRVVAQVRTTFEERGRDIQQERASLVRRKEVLEQKRNIAEEKLFARVITDEAFTRTNRAIAAQLEAINRQLGDLEAARSVDTDTIQQILRFARDIPGAYATAPPDLKRRYLAFFFTHFTVRDQLIIEAHPTEFVASLQEVGSVRSSGKWCPGRQLIRTLLKHAANTEWMRTVQALQVEMKRFAA